MALCHNGAEFVGLHDGSGVHLNEVNLAEDTEIGKIARKVYQQNPAEFSFRQRFLLFMARVRLTIRLIRALSRIVYILFRPAILAVASSVVLAKIWNDRHGILDKIQARSRFIPWLLALDVTVFNELRWLINDPVHRLDWFGHGHYKTKPGLYYAKNFNKTPAMNRTMHILQGCNFFKDVVSYKSPRWMLHGDLRTVVPTLAYQSKPLVYTRFCFKSSRRADPHLVTLDFAFPDEAVVSEPQPLVLLMAGVGGDSNAPYMRDLVAACTARNWIACVLLARGLGSALHVFSAETLFNPTDTGDALDTMNFLNKLFPNNPILLAGVSMGGLALCNILGRHAEEIPSSVKGCVTISAGFKCDMFNWSRYKEVYQPLIVAEILREVIGRYGHTFEDAKLTLNTVLASRDYAGFYHNFFAYLPSVPGCGPVSSTSRDAAFNEWKTLQEGEVFRKDVNIPLLVFASNDDPLHHPDLVGVETSVYRFDNPNVVYLLTSEGGHVGWPNKPWPTDFSFLTDVAMRFLEAALQE